MSKKVLGLLAVLLVVIVILVIAFTPKGAAQTPPAPTNTPSNGSGADTQPAADPQKLLVPRWFVTGLMLDGQEIKLEGKQPTIQFKPDGTANGTGGCNQFGADYQASSDGKLKFGLINATMMACDPGMQQETAYFKALAQVEQFKMAGMKLTLLSADGKTMLNLSLPPK